MKSPLLAILVPLNRRHYLRNPFTSEAVDPAHKGAGSHFKGVYHCRSSLPHRASLQEFRGEHSLISPGYLLPFACPFPFTNW